MESFIHDSSRRVPRKSTIVARGHHRCSEFASIPPHARFSIMVAIFTVTRAVREPAMTPDAPTRLSFREESARTTEEREICLMGRAARARRDSFREINARASAASNTAHLFSATNGDCVSGKMAREAAIARVKRWREKRRTRAIVRIAFDSSGQ